ncbi:hypothetical protein [Nonomuraea ceibae]|uniref:hypothetical protein n=1 Tax=Nonomuraea ceibae TaxID=1935170 RepID=UPI001C5F21C5|nr:hypothetical protein [Nonomuraea ceibae]
MSPSSEDDQHDHIAQPFDAAQARAALLDLRSALEEVSPETDQMAARLIEEINDLAVQLGEMGSIFLFPHRRARLHQQAEFLTERASGYLTWLQARREQEAEADRSHRQHRVSLEAELMHEMRAMERRSTLPGRRAEEASDWLRELAASEPEGASLAESWFMTAMMISLVPPPGMSLAPVAIYMDNDEDYPEVRQALDRALSSFGLEIHQELPRVQGSVWQAFVAAFKRQATPEGVDGAVGVARAGAEARWHGEPQSQITKAQGEAIAAILQSLENSSNALLYFSNVLILKIDGVPLVRELSPEQVDRMRRNPHLFTDPRLALQMLEEVEEAARRTGGEPGQSAITT